MAKADAKGIWLGDYLKLHEPEPVLRARLERQELAYAWVDASGVQRRSDDGGPLPPPGWWLRTTATIDCERHSVTGSFLDAMFDPAAPIINMYHVRIVVPASEPPEFAEIVPVDPFRTGAAGRPTAAGFVLREAERRIKDGEVTPRLGRLTAFAGELAAWWEDSRSRSDPPGPKLGANRIESLVRDLWHKSLPPS